jgi:hypothetical protein
MDDPPDTWTQYLQRDDTWGIVSMEWAELKSSYKAMQTEPDKVAKVKKELVHVAAALINMRVALDKGGDGNSEENDERQA